MLNEFTKKEAPIQGLAGLGGGVPSRLLTLASGEITYVDDVFSTFLYDGTGSAQTITNNIDLSGEGGLVWLKSRGNNYGWRMVDTERGATKALESYDTTAEATESNGLTAFTSTGFSVGTQGHYNGYESGSGYDMVSYTFRKCPGFFDIVTYTGNGSHRDISHNLGSEPGSIWIKRRDAQESWIVYHRSLHQGGGGDASTAHFAKLELEGSGTQYGGTLHWSTSGGGEDHTADTFHVGNHNAVNGNGMTYVAYLFAHNDGSFGEDSDEAVIKCGTYAGTGQSGFPGNKITLGFEPQWLLIKAIDSSGTDWEIIDNMRGMYPDLTNGSPYLRANLSNAEFSNDDRAVFLHADGFSVQGNNTSINGTSGDDFVYIAIRRPHKPPEAATEVVALDTKSAKSANTPSYTTNFPVDFALRRNNITSVNSSSIFTRLTAHERLLTDSTAAATTDSTFDDHFRFNKGYGNFTSGDSNDYGYFFKRAPGFMDVVTYTGTGSAQNVSHNLDAVPELIIVKARDVVDHWQVYSSVTDETDFLMLNSTDATNDQASKWNDTAPTSSVFTVNTDTGVNQNTKNYVALLFSSLDGICKVGSYTGTANAIDVDCGFTNGARFVLIKRTDSNTGGHWYVFDTSQGINSGNDPYFRLNVTNAQGTADLIDPLDAGFSVASGTTNVNYSGGTYLFLAIA